MKALEKKQDQRRDYMKRFFERSNGTESTVLNAYTIGKETGLDGQVPEVL
jgi:hypothetical protein